MSLRCLAVFLWVLAWVPNWELGAQAPVDAQQRQADVQALDSILSGAKWLSVGGVDVLSSRDALLERAYKSGDVSMLEWAQTVHGWLRSANDPHMRVRFEDLARGDVGTLAAVPPGLLDRQGPWECMAPGRGIAEGARWAWMEKTWPWVGRLCPPADNRGSSEVKQGGEAVPGLAAGMAVVDHGAFMRWVISDFSSGSPNAFRRSFRKCTRQLRRAGMPVMLDLRGNLGGYRTRRHAVLSFWLALDRWPQERERGWISGDAEFETVPVTPLVRANRPLGANLAILVDGLSFSASLLLVDALYSRDRTALFGVSPLGFPGGCSGSPEDHVLPGSGLRITVPTLYTEVAGAPEHGYGLEGGVNAMGTDGGWSAAVRWLLSSDLAAPR